MLDTILSTLGSVFTGGLAGLLGLGIKAYTSYKQQKLQYEHEEKMQELAIKAMQTEKEVAIEQAKMKLKEEEVRIYGETTRESYRDSQGDVSLLQTVLDRVYQKDPKSATSAFYNFLILLMTILRTSVRPVTTYYFEFFIFYIFMKVWILVGGLKNYPQDQLLLLFSKLLDNLLFCGTTVILWWFGSRAIDGVFGRKK